MNISVALDDDFSFVGGRATLASATRAMRLLGPRWLRIDIDGDDIYGFAFGFGLWLGQTQSGWRTWFRLRRTLDNRRRSWWHVPSDTGSNVDLIGIGARQIELLFISSFATLIANISGGGSEVG